MIPGPEGLNLAKQHAAQLRRQGARRRVRGREGEQALELEFRGSSTTPAEAINRGARERKMNKNEKSPLRKVGETVVYQVKRLIPGLS